MVHQAVILGFLFNIVICFGLPLASILYITISKKRAVKPILVGAGVFILFQMILRIPILTTVLPKMNWFISITKKPWIYGIFLGLTAGLFEEIGRFLGYKTLLKERYRWIDGFAFGVGHGGIEAILIVGIANINNLFMSMSILP